MLVLADWLVARGGGYGPISRSCGGSSTSEHKESRAFDWLLDATDPVDLALADALLEEILAPDDTGQPHALARRMGIMYVIWNDRMYAAYDGFVADALPQLGLPHAAVVLADAAPPRPHAHLADPPGREGPDVLVLRAGDRLIGIPPLGPGRRLGACDAG